MSDIENSPVAKRRRLNQKTALVDSDTDESVHSNDMLEESLRLSQMSIPISEKDQHAEGTDLTTDSDTDNNDDDENNNENDLDISSNDRPQSTPEQSLLDTTSDDTDDKELDNRKKLLTAVEKLACLDGKYFEVILDQSSLTGSVIANCKLCIPPKPFKGSLRSTSNFTTHLKRCHKNEFGDYTKYSEDKRKSSDSTTIIERKRWSCAFNQDQFEKNVANFILRFMIPFRAVEDPSLHKIFDDLHIQKKDCQLKHLTRYSLVKRVDKIFNNSFNDVRKEIQMIINNGGYMCTTADVWTGGARRFLGVTVSWIHPESLERKSAAIACRRFHGTHSFDAIANQLSDIHSSFGLTLQSIRATITDNGSNFVKAFKEFGVEALNDTFADSSENPLEDINEEFELSAYERDFDSIDENIATNDEFTNECEHRLPRHFRCASHSLNLTATTDSLKAIKESKNLNKKYFNVIGKCSSLWTSLRSPKINESLKEYLGISLKRPVVTRWNSTYDCIIQLLTVEEKLLDNSKLKLKKAFKPANFKFLKEFVRCSKPLACAIDRLQADKSYYGVLLPTLVSLKYEMKRLIDDETFIDCKALAQAIIHGVNKRFEKLFDPFQPDIDAFIAAISHPRFKGRWLTSFTAAEQRIIYERFSEVVLQKLVFNQQHLLLVEILMSTTSEKLHVRFLNFNRHSPKVRLQQKWHDT